MDKRKQRQAKERKRERERMKKRGLDPDARRLSKDDIDREVSRSHDALKNGDPALAERVARKALKGAPDHLQLLANLTAALEAQGRPSEALAVATRAVERHPEVPQVHANLGILQRFLGELDAARQSFSKAVELAPEYVVAWRNLSTVKRYEDAGDPDFDQLAALIEKAPLRSEARVQLHFALGKGLDDVGRYDDAFEQFSRGNRLQRAQKGYSRDGFTQFIDAIIEAQGEEFVQGEVSSQASSSAPILIVGMPRSGSTLIEQVLASHPDVTGVGEVRDLRATVLEKYPDALTAPSRIARTPADALAKLGKTYASRLARRAPDGHRVVDKALDNYLDVGLLSRALPNARIVYAERDLTANAFAVYKTLFTSQLPFAYDLGDIVHHARGIERLMDHWDAVLPGKVLRVSYEKLVADLEGESKRLFEHCGLDWDERALRFHETERPVASASATQVRQPLYGSAVEHWRNYESHLGELLEAVRAE